MEAVLETTDARKSVPGKRYPAPVRWWLLLGVVMVIGQVVIGGITRLTESGLSITEWEVISGTLPPLNAEQWATEFAKYQATPQYAKINAGMSMSDFKFIYFWEWFHRVWARTMGLAFAIPFLIFWRKGWIDRPLLKRLGMVILLAVVVASFGWIMVASGLVDRPWVDAYKLTMHLSLACILYGYLLWTTFTVWQPIIQVFNNRSLKNWAVAITVVLAIQIILGGVMSGARAALVFPTWPDLNGMFLPAVLTDGSMWTVENIVEYDRSTFQPALVQFLHRMTAYALTIMILYFGYRLLKQPITKYLRWGVYMLITLLVTQVVLGILTVINSIGYVPTDLGVLHQATALFLLSAVLYVDYHLGLMRGSGGR